MKQFLRSFLTLLMLVVWASGFAAETTYSYTFKSGDFSAKKKTNTLNGINWTLAVESWYESESYAWDNEKGLKIGSSNSKYPKGNVTITTTEIVGTIKKVTVNTSSNASSTTTLKVLVGDTQIGKQQSLTSTAKNFTFEGSATGDIVLSYADSNKPIFIKSISVIYEKGPEKTPTTLTFPETAISINGGDEASFKGQSAKLYAGEQELTDKTIEYAYTYTGDDIFATFDKTTGAATLKSGVYGTATVTATYAGDDTYAKAVASYTVTVKNPNVLVSTTTYDFVKNTYGYPQNGNLKNGAIISNESPVTIVNTKNGETTQSTFTNDDFRIYKAAVLTINAKEGCLINKITITGTRINQLNLNGKDGTWDNGVWTGSSSSVSFTNPGGNRNSVCFETITIEYTAPAPLTLEEDADDTETKIKANNGKTVDVKLTRSLKAGLWNTICLPFDVTAEQIKNILKAEGMVREYADDDATAQTITFKKVEGNMKAGEPYLIKPTEDITSLAFEGVTITAIEGNIQGKAYGICGTLGKYTMKTDGTELFLNAAGKFVAPAAATNTMKGFRAYFMVPSGASAAAININIDGETTGINNIETNATVNGKVYNLNGQYVGNSLNGLKKGIYVVNGKKVIK